MTCVTFLQSTEQQQLLVAAKMVFLVLLPVVVAASLILIATHSKKVDYKTEAKHQGRAGRDTTSREAKRRKKEKAPSTPRPMTRFNVSTVEPTPPHLKHSMPTPPISQQKKLRSRGGGLLFPFWEGPSQAIPRFLLLP